MKKKAICVLGVAIMVTGMAACKNKENTAKTDTEQMNVETEAVNNDTAEVIAYQSKLISLGDYKGLSYTDESGREPTDEEVEEEMQAILAWYEDGELTDVWVQENLELDSVDEFREITRQNLMEVYDTQVWRAAARELYLAVADGSEFEMDETEVSTERNDYIWSYQQMADAAEMSYEEYIPEATGMTVEEFETKAGESAEQVIKVELIAEAIAEAEQLDVEGSYDEIAGKIVEEEGFDSIEDLEQSAGGKGAVMSEVRYRLVAQFLMDEGVAVK